MAGYDSTKLDMIKDLKRGAQREFWYRTTDALATVQGAGYFSDGVKRGMKLGDKVTVFKTDGPNIYMQKVSAVDSGIASGLYTATVQAVDQDASVNGSFANLTATGNVALGDAASDTIGFYGVTKVSQRASAVQATSNISASTFATIGSNLAAFLTEVGATLQGLGAWKGAA